MRLARRADAATAVVAIAALVAAATGCTTPGKSRPRNARASQGTSATPSASTADATVSAAASRSPVTSVGATCSYTKYAGGVEKIDLKSAKLGFSQAEKDDGNRFRAAQTQSIKDEAKRLGYELTVTNAAGDPDQQITDIKGLVALGVKAIVVVPLRPDGLRAALDEAKANKIPVLVVDGALATSFRPCEDYIGWAGSDLVGQGRRAGEAIITATRGDAQAVTFLGPAGLAATEDRNRGYRDALANTSGVHVVTEVAANFDRTKAQALTTSLLAANPQINAIFAHNAEMALGVVAALKVAGRKPGDVHVVSIEGTKDVVHAVVDGWIDRAIEANPRFGPISFASLDAFYNGDGIAPKQTINDSEYSRDNAEAELRNAY